MKLRALLACGCLPLVSGLMSAATNVHPVAPEPVCRTATTHPMQYWVALPVGWDASREWPVLVVLEAAEKEYEANARRFVEARGDLPFIIVAPYIVSNGNQGLHDPKIFPYSPATWAAIDRDGTCAFDLTGLEAILADVRRDCRGKTAVYLTGFEAGTHLLWAYTFRHPEQLAGVVPVAGNYRGRCVDETCFSSHPARGQLPIHAITGSLDLAFGTQGPLFSQYLDAKKVAQQHGFQNITEEIAPGKDHVPLPGEVLAWCAAQERSH